MSVTFSLYLHKTALLFKFFFLHIRSWQYSFMCFVSVCECACLPREKVQLYWTFMFKMLQLLKYFSKSDPWIENRPCNSVTLDSIVKSPSEEELFGLYLKTRFEPRSVCGYIFIVLISFIPEVKVCRHN